MASSKHWALYATNYRLGTMQEHRLAGARIGSVGVKVDFNVLHGMRVTLYGYRLSLEVGWALRRDDSRISSYLDVIMRQDGIGERRARELADREGVAG